MGVWGMLTPKVLKGYQFQGQTWNFSWDEPNSNLGIHKSRSSAGSEVQLQIRQTILGSLHFIVRSFQVWSFHFMVRSFHSVRVKLVVKCALWGLWLKERGTHMSSTLVSACSLKTREKFWLYYGTTWLLGGTNWLGTILPWHEVTGYRQTNQMNLSNKDE